MLCIDILFHASHVVLQVVSATRGVADGIGSKRTNHPRAPRRKLWRGLNKDKLLFPRNRATRRRRRHLLRRLGELSSS